MCGCDNFNGIPTCSEHSEGIEIRREDGTSITLRTSKEGNTLVYYLGGFNDTTENGVDGKEVELGVNATHIQWRYVGELIWKNLVALSALKGTKGDKGDTGEKGDVGEQGFQGNDGAKGSKGDPGPALMLQRTATHIQWKNEDEEDWVDLLLLSEFVGATGAKGDKGDKGDTGEPGVKGDAGAQGPAGVFDSSTYYDSEGVWKHEGSSGSPEFGSWSLRFRRSATGVIHYSIRTYKNGGGNVTYIDVAIPPRFAAANRYFPAAASISAAGHIMVGSWHRNSDGPSVANERGVVYSNDGTNWRVQIPIRDDWTWIANGSYLDKDSI